MVLIDDGPPAKGETVRPASGPVAVEHAFRVDGKKLTVLLTFPAAVAQEVGLDDVLVCANRALVTIESKNHKVEKAR